MLFSSLKWQLQRKQPKKLQERLLQNEHLQKRRHHPNLKPQRKAGQHEERTPNNLI